MRRSIEHPRSLTIQIADPLPWNRQKIARMRDLDIVSTTMLQVFSVLVSGMNLRSVNDLGVRVLK